jgi:hypothetical protein
MIRSRNSARIGLLAGSIFILFFWALRAFLAEYDTVLTMTGTTRDVVLALADPQGNLPQPGSARATRDLLSACGRVLTVAPMLKADAGLSAQVSGKCNAIAQAILAQSPSHARALAVDLLTSGLVDAERLRFAQAAAPYEPWPLNIRLRAIAKAATLSPEAEAVAEADFQRALMSRWGQEEVVRIYQSNAALRPVIGRAAEKIDQKDQKAFVDLLRRKLGAAG